MVQSKQTCRTNKKSKHKIRCDYSQAPAKVEIRSQNLRAQIYGQSRAQQQQGNAKDHDPKGRYKICQLNLRKDGTWTQSIAKVSVVKDVHERIVKPRITLRLHRPKLIPALERLQDDKRRQIGTRRICPTEPSVRLSLSAVKGTFSRQVRNNRKTFRKKAETKQQPYSEEDSERWRSLPPPGHGVTGDGTNEVHRTSLFRFGEVWCSAASKALWTGVKNTHILTCTYLTRAPHVFLPAATSLVKSGFPLALLEYSH